MNSEFICDRCKRSVLYGLMSDRFGLCSSCFEEQNRKTGWEQRTLEENFEIEFEQRKMVEASLRMDIFKGAIDLFKKRKQNSFIEFDESLISLNNILKVDISDYDPQEFGTKDPNSKAVYSIEISTLSDGLCRKEYESKQQRDTQYSRLREYLKKQSGLYVVE